MSFSRGWNVTPNLLQFGEARSANLRAYLRVTHIDLAARFQATLRGRICAFWNVALSDDGLLPVPGVTG
jgi:hypothetical protein